MLLWIDTVPGTLLLIGKIAKTVRDEMIHGELKSAPIVGEQHMLVQALKSPYFDNCDKTPTEEKQLTDTIHPGMYIKSTKFYISYVSFFSFSSFCCKNLW